jgi:hypothetical protein
MNMEKVLPVFLGVLGSLVFCALLSVNGPGALGCYAPEHGEIAEEKPAPDDFARFFAEMTDENRDPVQEMYGEPDMQDLIIDFFAGICGSRDIAKAVLSNADKYKIPPALAFALGWEESRFNPRAVNQKNRDGSVDRGLFQLNNRSFPGLDSYAFFDIEVNAMYGMSHLRHCLNVGGTEIAALAMYNAGTGKVGSAGAPKSTLDYIHRILGNRRRIESRFRADFLDQGEGWGVMEQSIVAEKPGRTRLFPLLPLIGN